MKKNEPNNIPNDTLKWLKNSRFYGSLDKIFDVSLSKLQPRKEAQMGKSLNGKELGKGISQRKDGLYQARFVNRFGKRETIYAKTLNEIRHQLRTELSLCVQAPNEHVQPAFAWLKAYVQTIIHITQNLLCNLSVYF